MTIDYFRQLKGQPQAVELLQQAIAKNRIATAYLFVGPFGVGRSLAAKCFGRALFSLDVIPEQQALVAKRVTQGNHPDLFWVEPTYQHQGQLITVEEAEKLGVKRKALPQIRIEQIREITRFLNRPPLEASRALVVIESAQSMTESAANSLLKTLEEPGKATIILIAPTVDSLLSTLVSRCQKIPFYRLSQEDLMTILNEQELGEITNNSEVLDLAQGSVGQAILIKEQLQAIPLEIRHQLQQLPLSILDALDLAKTVAKELDTEVQLWLLDYLQYFYWNQLQNKDLLEQLEKAKQHLLAYVQPRLVWECLLINLQGIC